MNVMMSVGQPLVNDELKSLIGMRGPVVTTPDTVSTSEIRRFAQATFEENRIFYDDDAAKKSRFGGRIAPGTFPITSMRPNWPFSDDPLRWAGLKDEVHRVAVMEGLPHPHQWEGLYHFHAGDDVEICRLAHVGDHLVAHPYVKDIYERAGRNGAMAFYVIRTDWKNQRGELLASHDMNLVYMEQSADVQRTQTAQASEPQDPPKMAEARPLDLPRVNFEDIQVGQQLPTKLVRVTVPILFRWAAATEWYRRDHYDYDYATRVAGLPHIIGSALWTLSCRWSYLSHFAGSDGWVWKLSHQVRARLNIGDSLTIGGVVTKVASRERHGLVELDVNFTNQNGVVAVPGRAVVALPYHGGPAVPYPFVQRRTTP